MFNSRKSSNLASVIYYMSVAVYTVIRKGSPNGKRTMGEPSLFYKVTFSRTLQRDLVYTTLVATTLKRCIQEYLNDFLSLFLADKTTGH